MFISLFSRRLTSGFSSTLMRTAMRLYSGGGCKKDCPKTTPCVMEYPKKKCEEPKCLPKEPTCLIAFSECQPSKEDPSKPMPECCDSKRLALDPCNCKGARTDQKSNVKLTRNMPQLKSVWEWPQECCDNPCPEQLPRFDTLYYTPSDKAKRQYQQTWVECPPILIRKRKVCCYDTTTLPPICRRPKKECTQSACEFDSPKMKALSCRNTSKKCPQITMPCCRSARNPSVCKKTRRPTDCKKRCCPYPAFSECCRPCPLPKRPAECRCIQSPPLCIMYRYLKRKTELNLPPPLPAWPPQMIGTK